MKKKFDFSGWATRNNIKCADGRTIMRNAFIDNDGETVPLVWNHSHEDPYDVLGHALLENRPEGVYTYATFNNSDAAKAAKEAVRNGDITHLSIYANRLTHDSNKNVLHGAIREVSLVLAGANPGAYIDSVSLAHNDEGYDEDQGIIYNDNSEIHINDSDYNTDNDYTVEDVFNTLNDDQKDLVYGLVGQALTNNEYLAQSALEDGDLEAVLDTMNDTQKELVYNILEEALEHADEGDDNMNNNDYEEYEDYDDEDYDDEDYDDEDYDDEDYDDDDDDNETVGDVLDSLDDKQKDVVYSIIGQALEEGEENMKHNIFDDDYYEEDDTLMHDAMNTIIEDGQRFGSLRESYLQHADEYGIDNIDYLFPDAQMISDTPEFIKRPDEWVGKVMNGVRHTPFSRIKSIFADITEDEARAKGYIKGKLKKNEVFSLLKRITLPQTIYKKQKLDRDDITDITDFDVIAWLKTEMRMMLDEEIARAILVGDGRDTTDPEKINENNIRPIAKEEEFYAIQHVVTPEPDESIPHAIIKASVKTRKDYRGSGNPTFFCSEDTLADLLLIEDGIGRRLYNTENDLAAALRVKDIVAVPVIPDDIYGIIVNLIDYNVGADKGGSINMFDDFDIDFNQQKYLIETRCSGALVKPYSAIVLKRNS